MTLTLDDTLIAHLQRVLEDDIERAEDHLEWLSRHAGEPDRDAQLADTQTSIDLDKKLLALIAD
jgi:hypothetical protein